ncbi:MAG: aminoacyl-tRNA hydrolase [Porticoccaceae bacterium]|jgi:ribosome-associated protein|nr:aminoacyl-tRNA hydrolase [Porticoccaceae bacterium]MBT4591199.1 aminoacyl-tRNA hydrolase [Porticoccaceae bacterium]MBT7168997.1 aminoacyl-tRNA hydrolase [Porticoccaceae bacterium]MBT7964152.1 aminoacyl-tRNA hydrolase [Porticoccaceae bacterium]
MLIISSTVSISETELDISAIRAQGPGGQNVNKVSSAIHLRFDINQSSLPDFYKQRLLRLSDHRISKDGIVIIKAQQYRSQDKNRIEAIERLQQLIQSAGFTAKTRRPTKPTRGSQVRRVDKKTQHGKKKTMRGKPNLD